MVAAGQAFARPLSRMIPPTLHADLAMWSFSGLTGILLFATLLMPAFAEARPPRTGGGPGSHNNSQSRHGGARNKTPGVLRDARGRIQRSARAKNEFRKSHPCPSTGKAAGACPGFVIDHVTPLKRGGADNAGNMQSQTAEAARLKDKTE